MSENIAGKHSGIRSQLRRLDEKRRRGGDVSLGGVVVSVVWAPVGVAWLFVLHDSGEGLLLW